jgi:hypothetical protein
MERREITLGKWTRRVNQGYLAPECSFPFIRGQLWCFVMMRWNTPCPLP